MEIKITGKIQINGLNGRKTATMYENKNKIGEIGIIANPNLKYYQIEFFRVKNTYRQKRVGQQLLSTIEYEIMNVGGDKLIVYPNSEPYDGDPKVNIECLYEIYEKLGFEFEDKGVDRTKSNNKMIKELKNGG